MKRIKNYLELCFDIELLRAEIKILKRQRREIEAQIDKLSSGPNTYRSPQYHELKIDSKYLMPPRLEALYAKLEEINRQIEEKCKDLKALEYRKKNIDKIIALMDYPKNKVAVLREIQGMSLAEIADELGYSESHIKRLSAEISQEIYSEK